MNLNLYGTATKTVMGTVEYDVRLSTGSKLCHTDEMARCVKCYPDPIVSWGYEGTGPLQLAVFVLYYILSGGYWGYYGTEPQIIASNLALKHHEAFMREVVANWGDNWEITKDEVMKWIKEKEANGAGDNIQQP